MVSTTCIDPWVHEFMVSTKCIDPWVHEFGVSNTICNNQPENYISLELYSRDLSEQRNQRKLEPGD